MIEPFHVTIVNRGELATTARRILEVLKEVKNEPFLTADMALLLQNDLEDLTEGENRETQQPETKLIHEQDSRRDRAFISLSNHCKSYETELDPDLRLAALTLEKIFDKHSRTLWSSGFIQQSAALKNFFSDMDLPEARQALTAIAGQKRYEVLKKEQQEFERIYQQKIAAESRENIPLLPETTRRLKRHIKCTLAAIQSIEEIRPDPIKNTVDKINEIIIDIMTVARARKTRIDGKTEETEE